MTFGEHIEELRTHLIRALQGTLVAFVLMTFCGHWVVRIIVDPVETRLREWWEEHLEKRGAAYVAQQSSLPAGQQRHVHIEATLDEQSVRLLAKNLGVAESASLAPMKVTLDADAGSLVRDLSAELAQVNQPWQMKGLAAQEAFMIWFKAVMGASIVVASPWIFYQIYSFIAVGLYAHERRFVNLTLPFSILLFLAGVLVCFFIVFPNMLRFFLAANDWMDIQPDIRLSEWVGFAVMLTIIFGVTFQMPLLMLMLERVGIITHDQLAKQRKLAVFGCFLLAAVISPGGDPYTMLFLAIPTCILFELGLFLMRYFERTNPFAVDDPSRGDDFF